jgi:hypothetical protein
MNKNIFSFTLQPDVCLKHNDSSFLRICVAFPTNKLFINYPVSLFFFWNLV